MKDLPSENRGDVPWGDIVRFVRQFSHDQRNHLNAAELQSAFIAELAENDELKSEIKRLREMIAECGASLQRLTSMLAPANPTFMSYRAADFVEDLKQKADSRGHAGKVTWESTLGDASLNIDPQLLEQAFLELFANAFRHEPGEAALAAKAYVDKDRFTFTLSEPKKRFELPTENWGREPLRKVNRGHYGLGLNHVRAIIQAHGGEFGAQFDPAASVLLSTVKLPLASD
jgi:K+-sensing histidine kinase KdpD